MLKLSKLTDYAVVLLTHIVRREGVVATAPSLCEATHLPQPTVAKILKMLAHGGLLNAQRGASGGYVLAREARAISIAEIITVMDGPIHLTECADNDSHECQMSNTCAMHGRWNHVNHAIRTALQNVSLYDMALDAPAFAPRLGAKETALRE
ncbi:MAG: SUF system Fe-S cluster assembly regulator [Proteobacteria bacterium]|nr:SUF system Fe-S cluster assembly regulator [Pseudomonadota bacterium]